MTQTIHVGVIVDAGKSFVDEDGNFYCGTTAEQKEVMALCASVADLLVYFGDVHARRSPEFIVNGGLYPTHNLVKKDWYDLEQLGVAPRKTVSPELTDRLQQVVAQRPSGLIVSRHVFFQDYNCGKLQPCFTYEDVEETFGVKRFEPGALLDGELTYVINAKHLFNGAATQATEWMGHFPGIPDREENVASVLKRRWGLGNGMTIDIYGVVMGICVYQTASGLKQIFPKAAVNVVADGCTHLLVPQLGFSDERTADEAIQRVCQQVGINYVRSNAYLGETSRR